MRKVMTSLFAWILVLTAAPAAAQVDIEGPGGGPQPDPSRDIQVGIYLYIPGPSCSIADFAFAAKNTSRYFEYKIERTGDPEVTCAQSGSGCALNTSGDCPGGCSDSSNTFDGFMGDEVLGVAGTRNDCAARVPQPGFPDCDDVTPENQCDNNVGLSEECDDTRWCASIPNARVVAKEYRSAPNGSWTPLPGGPVTICENQAVIGQQPTAGRCPARSMCFELDCSGGSCEPPTEFPAFSLCSDLPLVPLMRR